MILYNGSSGSLGHYFRDALDAAGVQGRALLARLEDRARLREELATVPEPVDGNVQLVHLAAKVSVRSCEEDPEAAFRTNVRDASATVEEVADWAASRRLGFHLLYVSTGHVYQAASSGHRLTEDDPVEPRSVYARSKLQAERELLERMRSRGVRAQVVRVFGLIAPRQPSHYVLPGLIGRVRRADVLEVPGLDGVRDYLDSRDVCATLVELCERPAARGELLNVCSGEPVSIRKLLELVIRTLRPEDADRLLGEATAAPGRPDDIPWIVGDPGRLTELTGHPARRIPLGETVRDAIAAG